MLPFRRQRLAAVLLFLAGTVLYGQDSIDYGELESVPGQVEFIDNTAVPAQIDTRQQIVDIGVALGVAAQAGAAGDTERYFVIHRLHPAEFDRLDGDILGLGPAAGVDMIRNLRLIIQGYLEGAYGYSAADAALLSEYITVYNAVYRQNRAYFSRRYKTPLLADLTEGMEGLSTRWDEWAGNTLIVIPLQTAEAGSLSAIDTTAITGGDVVNELRKEDDMGLEERRLMVELKEREAEEAEERAADLRDGAEERELAERREAVEAERQRIAEERERISAGTDRPPGDTPVAGMPPGDTPAAGMPPGDTPTAGMPSGDTPAAGMLPGDGQAAGSRLAEQQAALDEREAAVEAEEAEIAEREEALAETRRQAEEFAARKREEAEAERADISQDMSEMIAADGGAPAGTPAAAPAGVVGIRLVGRDASIGVPVLVAPSSGQTLKTSALNTVRARTLVRADGKLIAIAGESDWDGVHRLVEIDAETLHTVRQSEDEINNESLIWVNGADLYVIVNGADGNQYIARFDTDLTKQAQSAGAVHPFATVHFEGGRLLIQNADGDPMTLDPQSLN
jgi:hypothetical protein